VAINLGALCVRQIIEEESQHINRYDVFVKEGQKLPARLEVEMAQQPQAPELVMSDRLIERVLVGELPDLNNELVEIDNKVQENQAAKNGRVGQDFLPLGQGDQQECCQV